MPVALRSLAAAGSQLAKAADDDLTAAGR